MMQPKTISFHKSCSTLPIYNFYKASLFQDLRYLIKGYDEDEPSHDAYKQNKELAEILKNIVKQYAVLTNDKKTMKLKKMEYELIFLRGRYNLIIKVLGIYRECKMVEVLDVLNDLEVPFDKSKPIGKQIDKAIQTTKGLKNKINIKQLNFKKLSGIKDDDTKQDPNDAMASLDKTALLLETNLELGYRVNIRTTNMERWTNLLSMNADKVAASQRA